MSKKYKVKHDKNEILENDSDNTLSKKELYDLKKQEKDKKKVKEIKKQVKKKKSNKKKNKTYKTSLVGRIFAVLMLILMLGSVIATISYSFR